MGQCETVENKNKNKNMNEKIKHLDLNTPDGAQLNMDALYQIAPSVFTESRDPRGRLSENYSHIG